MLMKRLLFTGLSLVMLTALTGCPKSEKGGATTAGDETFTLSKVLTSTSVSQGGAKEVEITLNRGKDFKQDVKMKAEKVPENVTVTFTPNPIKPSDDPKTIMKIEAAKDAAQGETTLTVWGTPVKGAATSIEVTIKIGP
jgi:hypothetical protein